MLEQLAQSDAAINTALLVGLRLFGAVALSPGLGSMAVPPGTRAVLAITLSTAFTMHIGVQAHLGQLALPVLGWMAVTELLMGMIIGLAVMLPVLAIRSAGSLIGMAMGIGFSVSIDPISHNADTVASRLYGAIAALAFLAAGGPQVLLRVVGETFRLAPLGVCNLEAMGGLVGSLGSQLFTIMLRVAAPAVVSAFLAQTLVGLIGRSSPALNIFSIGFGITLCIGLAAVVLSWPTAIALLPETMEQSIRSLEPLLAPRHP